MCQQPSKQTNMTVFLPSKGFDDIGNSKKMKVYWIEVMKYVEGHIYKKPSEETKMLSRKLGLGHCHRMDS